MQNLTRIIVSISLVTLAIACGSGSNNGAGVAEQTPTDQTALSTDQTGGNETAANTENPSYDPKRGEGKWTTENVKADSPLDNAIAASGEKVAGVKCFSCHKATDEKLVGPGWKGVTTRRKPEWIMNFITNPDPMIDKDPEVQAQLELCLVRMPNQGLEDKDARDILEFMRKNDMSK
ncbi:MAG TPA: c-type cytochrome [Catalimonadaceae bacterium]|nr:c-type cytochrome [Catalimonadaceae bacterium]